MAVGDFLTKAVQGQDMPAHIDRILATVLLNEGVVDVAGGSFEVTEDTGSNMNITVGSGTLGDLAVIEGDDTAGQGVYVIEAQNATVTKTIAASDPSDDRIDLVVLQNYDDEADSSGNNDAEVEVIEGTPAGSPSAPALPDSAIPLAEVLVGAGVTAITDANITDTRENAKTGGAAPGGVLDYAEVTSSQSVTSETDLSGFTVTIDVPANRRVKLTYNNTHFQDTANSRVIAFIKESTTTLQTIQTHHNETTGTGRHSAYGAVVLTPSAGSHTYKVTMLPDSGTATSDADAARPGFLLAEDIGPA